MKNYEFRKALLAISLTAHLLVPNSFLEREYVGIPRPWAQIGVWVSEMMNWLLPSKAEHGCLNFQTKTSRILIRKVQKSSGRRGRE